MRGISPAIQTNCGVHCLSFVPDGNSQRSGSRFVYQVQDDSLWMTLKNQAWAPDSEIRRTLVRMEWSGTFFEWCRGFDRQSKYRGEIFVPGRQDKILIIRSANLIAAKPRFKITQVTISIPGGTKERWGGQNENMGSWSQFWRSKNTQKCASAD